MIQAESGQINLGNDQIISHNTTLEAIQAMNLGQSQHLKNLKNGWIWYDVKNLNIEEQYYNISFLFENESLKGLSFVFQQQAFDVETTGWSSWSETAELEKAKQFNAWLDEQLDGQRDFEWGTVWAGYAPKSGASSIRVSYIPFA